jgi:hypothetical protein
MLNIYKLINGEDLMGNVVEEAETGFFIENPVSYVTSPNHGFQMKDWLILANTDTIFLENKNIIADLGAPNDFGAQCYDSFVSHRKVQKDFLSQNINDFDGEADVTDLSEDVKEIFAALQPTSKFEVN